MTAKCANIDTQNVWKLLEPGHLIAYFLLFSISLQTIPFMQKLVVNKDNKIVDNVLLIDLGYTWSGAQDRKKKKN